MTKLNDLTGQRFGKLTIQSRAPSGLAGARWNAACDCGGSTVAAGTKLRSGTTQSCGCNRQELGARRFKHGESNSGGRAEGARLYRVWQRMKARCYNPNDNRFYCYGARGVRLCPEWLNDYIAFRDWSTANGYSEALTIDRIDNDGIYEPSNCRWATMAEQMKNRSKQYRRAVPG